MTATLRAVADAAGVHVATASRALNAQTSHMVRADTRARILEAATRLDYHADAAASALRSGRSGLVGILVPGLGNPVYAPMIAGAAGALDDAGLAAIVGDTAFLHGRSASLVRALLARRVDGLLLTSGFDEGDPGAELARQRKVPVLLVNRGMPGFPAVQPDNMRAMRLVVDHLVGLGHRAIGYVGGHFHTALRNDRRDAFDAAMAWHGLPSVGPRLRTGFERADGREAALRLLAEAPDLTALVCGNDLIAVGVFDAARQLGLRIPQELSVTGHNDVPFMDLLSPPMTTLRIDYQALGREAAAAMLRMIAGESISSVLMPATLMERGSTAPPRLARNGATP